MLSGYDLSQLCMREVGLTDPPQVSGQVSLILKHVPNQFQSCLSIHTAQHMNWKVSVRPFLVHNIGSGMLIGLLKLLSSFTIPLLQLTMFSIEPTCVLYLAQNLYVYNI